MKKKMYIQPKMEVSMMKNETLMRPASPGVAGGYEPGMPTSPAPQRRVPTAANDSVPVF